MAGKVFSIDDFRRGLDTRRTALTAPGGSLRILENALINPGGEIEKRNKFVWVGTADYVTKPWCMIGQNASLHIFSVDTPPIFFGGDEPNPVASTVFHILADPGEPIVRFLDVETFGTSFYVTGTSATRTYCWYGDQVYLAGTMPLVLAADHTSKAFGHYARTFKQKMYVLNQQYLQFSGVGDPAENDPSSVGNPGAGFIELSRNDPDAEAAISMEVFYGQMAIFARLATQIWKLDPDPTLDELQQVIRVGTVAPQSVHQLFTGDIMFLSDSGVRSLKSQTINAQAGVNDVGAAIDLLLRPILRDQFDLAATSVAIVQPTFGRYWISIGDTIYVLSYFPAGEITAWSTFKPGFQVRQFAVITDRIAVMDTTGALYFYGGGSRNVYDSARVIVRTPHHSADKATENKRLKSVDVMCEGTWSLKAGMLANNLDAFEQVATLNNNTFGLQSIPFAGYGTHFAFELIHEAPGPALLAAIHCNIQEGWTK